MRPPPRSTLFPYTTLFRSCPYRVRRNDVNTLEAPAVFGECTRLIEMPVSWSLDDYPHFEFVRTRESILPGLRSEEHTSELQSQSNLVCRLLLEKKNIHNFY